MMCDFDSLSPPSSILAILSALETSAAGHEDGAIAVMCLMLMYVSRRRSDARDISGGARGRRDRGDVLAIHGRRASPGG